MKQYDNDNYSRYKKDVKASQPKGKFWDEYTKDELIIKFLPLVENIARKFSTSDSASGIMNIQDLMSMGKIGLIQAVNKIVWSTILQSNDSEKTLKSYLFAIIGAEYILRWLPIGTHDWENFVEPSKLILLGEKNQLKLNKIEGIKFDIISNNWKLSKDKSVNYIMQLTKT